MMNNLIEIVLALVVLAGMAIGIKVKSDAKAKQKQLDENLEELKRIRMQQKVEALRRQRELEAERAEIERRINEVERMDITVKEAADYIRRRYDSTDSAP